ncbi:phage tail assembly chaperone [Anaerosinus massiliensis]|uniref:phage tail assembly chaperone n=1 Tax=Massilibacillus massiliensis TaxID=1806837 RepID=UPI000DA60C42|nr:hypothetical protein [Massilibacillus massiliensis]
MSLIDKLLQTDAKKLTEIPTKKFEIKRLSEKIKEKFEMTLIALTPERYAEIQRMTLEFSKKGGIKDVNMFDPKILTVLDGVKDPNLKDPKMLAHLGAATPKDLVTKLFLSGEIDDIKAEIDELSGYDKEDEEVNEEVKN